MKITPKIKTIYMVMFNLQGLYPKVAKLSFSKDFDNLWSTDSNDGLDWAFSEDENKVFGWNLTDGCCEYLTKSKKEAEKLLKSLLFYKNFLANKL